MRRAIRLIRRRRFDAERVGETDEEVEQGCVVGRLGDLFIGPPDVTERLHLIVRDSVGVHGDGGDEIHEFAVSVIQTCGVDIAITQGLRYGGELLALQLQEPCV